MINWTEIESIAGECENGSHFSSGADEQTIKSYEAVLGFPLSPILREWISVHHCDMIGPGGVLAIEPDDQSFGVVNRTRLHDEWVSLGWVPLGGDWCGNYYVVATMGEQNLREPVYFLDAYEDQSKPTYIAASSLYVFIKNYLRFDSGKLDFHWPFDKEKTIALDPDLALSAAPMPWEA